jgi:hypothetical protein
MIIITSKKDGFRRCGVAHPSRPTEHADDKFTEDELKSLQEEPMLTVVVSEGEPAEKAKTTWPKAEIKAATIKAAHKSAKAPDILDRDK